MKKISDLCKEIKRECSERKLLFIIGYSGHGVMSETNYIVCNHADAKYRYFPLEHHIFCYCNTYENTYGIGLFDCCRESVSQEEVKPKTA